MKYYFLSAGLIVVTILVILAVPLLSGAENSLVTIQTEVPENNTAVIVQKYVYPPASKSATPLSLSAHSILIKDLATNTILYKKDSDSRIPIASTTKIMTALIGSEYFKPNSVLTVGSSSEAPGSKVGLILGEKLTFRSLLFGMLLSSGNDASYAIAENYPGGLVDFVAAMNQKTEDLGLLNTHFDNPAGFDSPNHFSSANDLSKITEEALKNSDLSRIFATKETEIVSLDKKEAHKLTNLNKLLTSLPGVLGVKTGFTIVAKENLVTLVERGGHRVLTVVLGSDDRFGETSQLVEWTYRNFIWQD